MCAKPVCVVTGGSSGIGLAVCQKFAALGYAVATCGRRTEALAEARARIAGPAVETLVLDVAQPRAAPQLIEHAARTWGRVDVLVNNAGFAPLAPIAETSDEQFQTALAINISAVFYGTRAAWPIMQRQGGGVIVNLSSLSSIDPFPGFGVYGPCKAWVNLFSKVAADEGRPHDIRVYCVAPGAVETPMLRGAFPGFPPEQCLAASDVAELIAAVCQRPFQYASGQTLFVRR